jgi:RNase P subunit RPR2
MKIALSKTQAKERIDSFFKREKFTAEEIKKIKRLAMKFKVRLGEHRKLFCKKCLSKLNGKTRMRGEYKTIICKSCSYKNRFTMNKRD